MADTTKKCPDCGREMSEPFPGEWACGACAVNALAYRRAGLVMPRLRRRRAA